MMGYVPISLLSQTVQTQVASAKAGAVKQWVCLANTTDLLERVCV